ncbi:MAG: hypothetical protein JO135_01085 [Candidatus Eremiobacteraeota bacterium]|nr:hypothetical protein [Candidatus Eremiobacteraeota bacterium]
MSVNSEPMGRTDSRGDLLLRKLAPYRDNAITASEEDVPLGVDLRDPQHVVPASASPADVTIGIASRGGFTASVFDAAGNALAPGTQLTSSSGSFVVGYDGRIYITGLQPGPRQLIGVIGTSRCVVDLTVPRNLEDFPNLGHQVCRVQP